MCFDVFLFSAGDESGEFNELDGAREISGYVLGREIKYLKYRRYFKYIFHIVLGRECQYLLPVCYSGHDRRALCTLQPLPCQNTTLLSINSLVKTQNKRNKIQIHKTQNPWQNTTLLSINAFSLSLLPSILLVF